MGKRLFFVLPVLFVFSLLFVQVSEAGAPDPGTYTYTVTKIGFYRSYAEEPDADTIIDLPSSQTVHIQVGGETPNISDFVYLGNIPNGNFIGIGLYVESSTEPGFDEPEWLGIGFDNEEGVAHTFTDSSRKNITVRVSDAYATVTDL